MNNNQYRIGSVGGQFDNGRDYGSVTLYINTVELDLDGVERSMKGTSAIHTEGLVVSCQLDARTEHAYANRVGFDAFGVQTLNTLERQVKTLRFIQRHLDKQNAEWGFPKSFAYFALRVALILKLKKIRAFFKEVGDITTGQLVDHIEKVEAQIKSQLR